MKGKHRIECAQCGAWFFADNHRCRVCSDACRTARKSDEQRRRLARKLKEDPEALRAWWRERELRGDREKRKARGKAWRERNRQHVNRYMRERRYARREALLAWAREAVDSYLAEQFGACARRVTEQVDDSLRLRFQAVDFAPPPLQ